MTFQYPIKQLVLSHSARSTFRSCNRKFEFAKMFGDPSDREEMYAAEIGKCLHTGFQDYLIHKDETKAIFAMMMEFPFEMEYTKDENSRNRPFESVYATLMELIRSPVVDRYELVKIKTKDGDEKHAIEVSFAIEITNSPLTIPVWFVGFIDAILYDRVEDRYLVTDIKTTRANIVDYSVRYEFDEQTVPYGIILEHILGKKIDEFKVSYLSAYIDLLEPKVSMYPFIKTQEHIHDWFVGLCEDISRIGRYYKKQFFPRATDGNVCYSYNKPCWFATYCSNRNPEITNRLIGGVPRNGLFHDNQEPWIVAQLDYQEIL